MSDEIDDTELHGNFGEFVKKCLETKKLRDEVMENSERGKNME